MCFINESEFIRSARIKSGLTQSDIANKLGLTSPQMISNAERGLCALPPNKVVAFCDCTKANPRKYMKVKLIDLKAELEAYLR